MFQGGEAELRAVIAHNTHENISKVQEGGTALLTYGPLIDHIESSAKDETGLGRWVVTCLQGSDGLKTRVVCAYNPCHNTKQNSSTSYQQQRRYWINQHNHLSCPRSKFRDDLVALLLAHHRARYPGF